MKKEITTHQDNPTHKDMNIIRSIEVFRGGFDDNDSLDSEESRRIFTAFAKRRPTLDMALRAAGIKNHDILLEESCRLANTARKDPEIAKLGLSDDEAGAISCYTLEGIAYGKSPCQIINEGLTISRNRANLSSIGRLLFLLLSGLRKLPRTRPSRGQIFYRGIRAKVPQTRDEANDHQYYEEGRTVTWWGFTSTTTNVKVVNDFIQGAAASTVFRIGGEDLWGYDINAFSGYPKEDEIFLELEAKVFVDSLENLGTLSMIGVILQPFNHLVLEDIIPVGNASPVPTQMDQASKTKKWDCAWKECPDDVYEKRKYNVGGENLRVATKINGSYDYSTIIGSTPIPPNTVTSWSIKVLKSRDNDGYGVYIGMAPSDIGQNDIFNYNRCGWYLNCWSSTIRFGPPHNYGYKAYGPRKGDGQYVHTGDSVGVVVDTTKGDLSFVLNGVNLGAAYCGIPLDKPLVPCILLYHKDDSVELII